eukprot:15140694-Ditylum_brightwellii.AAC.2
MDNGLVLVVSTIHHVGSSAKVNRRRPHLTLKNKRHVPQVWRSKPRTEIYPPLLIHHYNQWMGGVDLIDQCISYYIPNFHCHRNWIPILIQILAMIRNNCYVAHSDSYSPTKSMTHKMFTLYLIEDLINKGDTLKKEVSARIPRLQSLPTAYPSTALLLSTSPSKRKFLLPNSDLKKTFFDVYSHCFQGPTASHVP